MACAETRGIGEPRSLAPRAPRTVFFASSDGTTSAKTVFFESAVTRNAAESRQAAAGEPGAEQVAGTGEPPLDRPDRPPELVRDLLVRLPFEVAEDHRRSVFLGQSADLVMEHRPEFAPRGVELGNRGRHLRALPFVAAAPLGVGSGSHRDPIGDLVKPASQHAAVADRSRLPREHEEGCLEGILRILMLGQDMTANAQDHGAVPAHQDLEGRLRIVLTLAQEEIEQLLVRQRLGASRGTGREARGNPIGSSDWHNLLPVVSDLMKESDDLGTRGYKILQENGPPPGLLRSGVLTPRIVIVSNHGCPDQGCRGNLER